MISQMVQKMKTTGLGELVEVLESLESHIEVDNEGWHITMRIHCLLVLSLWALALNIFPPITMSYGQPSSNPSASIDEEYGMINYPYVEQMSFHIPYQMQQGFLMNMWVNPEFPIHGEVVGTSQDIYA